MSIIYPDYISAYYVPIEAEELNLPFQLDEDFFIEDSLWKDCFDPEACPKQDSLVSQRLQESNKTELPLEQLPEGNDQIDPSPTPGNTLDENTRLNPSCIFSRYEDCRKLGDYDDWNDKYLQSDIEEKTSNIEEIDGKILCVVKAMSPAYIPDMSSEFLLTKKRKLINYFMLRGVDCIVVENFIISERMDEWMKFLDIVYSVFGLYLTTTFMATVFVKVSDPRPTGIAIFNLIAFKYFRGYYLSDPITEYRSIDMIGIKDTNFLIKVHHLINVNSRFTKVYMRREDIKMRSGILTAFITAQLVLATYKFAFGLTLQYLFPDRYID